MKLKEGVAKILLNEIFIYILFVSMTIDNILDNKIYNIIFVIFTIISLASFILLYKYKGLNEYE